MTFYIPKGRKNIVKTDFILNVGWGGGGGKPVSGNRLSTKPMSPSALKKNKVVTKTVEPLYQGWIKFKQEVDTG